MDTVITTKQNCIFPNNKQWMTKDVRHLLKACNTVFRPGNTQQCRDARLELKRVIRGLKVAYRRRKIEDLQQIRPLMCMARDTADHELEHQLIQQLEHITTRTTSSGTMRWRMQRLPRAPAPATNNQVLILQTAEVQ